MLVAVPLYCGAGLAAQPAVVLDCRPGTPGCAPLEIRGERPYVLPDGSPSPFSGTADPCVRLDPADGKLVLAYSWPHYRYDGDKRTPAVSIHLAASRDGGSTWDARPALWEAQPMANPADPGVEGLLEQEAATLCPALLDGKPVWFAARLNYFMPHEGGAAARRVSSFHLTVFRTDSLEELSRAQGVRLGGNLIDAAWGAAVLVPPDLRGRPFFWNEPSLFFRDGTLYLAAVAFAYRGSEPDMARNGVYVYSVQPRADPASWQWEYRGKLAGAGDAAELGGQRLSQVELTDGRDGRLLLLASPDDWVSSRQDYNHKGCVVLEVASLSPPALGRGPDGRLRVVARVFASDAGPLGSAAASYAAASATGLLFTRRDKSRSGFTIEIWKTGLRF
jgi:hypothetical protein